MPGRPATLVIKILADALNAQKGLKDTESAVGKVESQVGSLTVPALAAGTAVLAFGASAAGAASEVEQSFGAVESVFKDNSDTVKKWSRDSAKATGLATADYAQMSAVVGAQLKGMGTDIDALAPTTDQLIRKAADLSATFGGPTSDAVSAISALLRGERDPIERYGVSIKQADVDARLLADGLVTAKQAAAAMAKAQAAVVKAQAEVKKAREDGTPAELKAAEAHLATAKGAVQSAAALTGLDTAAMKNATAQATLAILTEQTADAQGAFARETDTAAHAQQVAAAEWTNAQAAIGEALLPAVIAISGALSTFSKFVTENKDLVLALGGIILGFAAAILAANVALKVYRATQTAVAVATKAWAAVQWLLNAALAANPIGIIIIAVIALVAAIVLLWTRSETFRTIVTAVFNTVLGVIKGVVDWVVRAFGTLAGILSKPFNDWMAVVKRVIGVIEGLFKGLSDLIGRIMGSIKKVGDAISGVINNIPKLPNLFVAPAPPAPAPAPSARGRSREAGVQTSGAAQPVTIILDGEVFGRATIGSLRRFDRRNGAPQVLPRWS